MRRIHSRRRTKRQYLKAFDVPTMPLAIGSADDAGARLILFPNGRAGAIWIESADGQRKFSIEASDGPAGLGLNIYTLVGETPMVHASGRHTEIWTTTSPTNAHKHMPDGTRTQRPKPISCF